MQVPLAGGDVKIKYREAVRVQPRIAQWGCCHPDRARDGSGEANTGTGCFSELGSNEPQRVSFLYSCCGGGN